MQSSGFQAEVLEHMEMLSLDHDSSWAVFLDQTLPLNKQHTTARVKLLKGAAPE